MGEIQLSPFLVILTVIIFIQDTQALNRDSGIPMVLWGEPLASYSPASDLPCPSERMLEGSSNYGIVELTVIIVILILMAVLLAISYNIFFRPIDPKLERAESKFEAVHFARVNERLKRKLALQKQVEDRAARTIQKAWSDYFRQLSDPSGALRAAADGPGEYHPERLSREPACSGDSLETVELSGSSNV